MRLICFSLLMAVSGFLSGCGGNTGSSGAGSGGPPQFSTLASFIANSSGSVQSLPNGPLAQDVEGTLYGVAAAPSGSFFKLSTQGGAVMTLYTFCTQTNCPDGNDPESGIIRGINGNFYGTTTRGGPGGVGKPTLGRYSKLLPQAR